MLRRTAVALLVAAVASTALFLTTEVHAGGPTSVLLTNLDSQRAAGLYYTDEQYLELETLLHGDGTTRETAAASPPGGGTYFNVTWLVHDVSVWRTDQLVLDVEGAPWIYTQLPQANGGGLIDGGGGLTDEKWRSLKNGGAIVDLLVAIGVVGDEEPTSTVDSVTTAAAPAAGSQHDTAASVWRWAVPGLVVGLLAGWLIARWRTRARLVSEPRQVTVG